MITRAGDRKNEIDIAAVRKYEHSIICVNIQTVVHVEFGYIRACNITKIDRQAEISESAGPREQFVAHAVENHSLKQNPLRVFHP